MRAKLRRGEVVSCGPCSVVRWGALCELELLVRRDPAPKGQKGHVPRGEQKAIEGLQQDKKECILPRRPPQHLREEASVIR